MKEIIKLGSILCIVTVIAGAALSFVNTVTKPRIEAQKRLVTERALMAALPDADKQAIDPVKKDDEIQYYIGYKSLERKEIVGYAFVAKGPGYSSVIETMVGVDTTGTIKGIQVMQQVETPGLGTKIEEIKYGDDSPWFQRQFIAKKSDALIIDKDGGPIKTITGATISSQAVTTSIKLGIQNLAKQIESFKTENE